MRNGVASIGFYHVRMSLLCLGFPGLFGNLLVTGFV